MPGSEEPLSRGRFLKLCAAGAVGLAVTACGADDDDEEDDEEEEGEEDDEEDGGLY